MFVAREERLLFHPLRFTPSFNLLIRYLIGSLYPETGYEQQIFARQWSSTHPKNLFKDIKSLQCYELTRRCSHLLLCTGFTIDLSCVPFLCA